MKTDLIIQGAIGVVPIVVAYFAYRAATRANAVTQATQDRISTRAAELEKTKVDSEAFQRAKSIYEAALESLEKQLDRIQVQFDRMNDQLSREQDTSNTLRTQVNVLQQQVQNLERTISELRRQLVASGIRPPPSVPDEQ